MKILPAEGALVEEHAGDVPQLVWSTGPISYEFYFETYEFFEEMVRESWTTAGTLFAADGARLAVEGDELLGIEIGFHAPRVRRAKKGAQSGRALLRVARPRALRRDAGARTGGVRCTPRVSHGPRHLAGEDARPLSGYAKPGPPSGAVPDPRCLASASAIRS